jgi:hypothetical protein
MQLELDNRQAARDLAVCAFLLCKAGENLESVADHAIANGYPRLGRMLHKAAVAGAVLSDPNWSEASAMQGAFAGLMREQGSVLDTILPYSIRLPARAAGVRLQTSVIQGQVIAEGQAKPIFALNFTSPLSERRKSAAIIVVTNELLSEFPERAVSLLERELSRGVVAVRDFEVLSILATDIAPITSAGTDAADVLADLATALASMQLSTASQIFAAVSPTTCQRLALMPAAATNGVRAFPDMTLRGGQIAGIRFISTDQPPSGSPTVAAVLIDASRIAAWSEGVGITRVQHASVQMSDTPVMFVGNVGSPDTSIPVDVVSLWQVNASGIRAERWWNINRLQSTAVAVIEGSW